MTLAKLAKSKPKAFDLASVSVGVSVGVPHSCNDRGPRSGWRPIYPHFGKIRRDSLHVVIVRGLYSVGLREPLVAIRRKF